MKLSIVTPVYNEEDSLPLLRERLSALFKQCGFDYEMLFVNDGSVDSTSQLIKDWIKEDHRVVLLELSRNFGHQQAITAGLQESTGDCVVIMDADLQDPPEEIPKMVKKWEEGFKVVLAERTSRNENFLRKMLFSLFYKVFVSISDMQVLNNSGVFGLMDRVVVNHLLNMGERSRFLPGMRGWLGFETTTIYYDREDRQAGHPKQTLRKLIRYALNAIFSFSYKPLRVSIFIGFTTTMVFFLYGLVLVYMRVMGINVVKGFTTPTVAIFFIGGLLLMSNGIIGEYIARIYDEVKNRPLYIANKKFSRKQGGQIMEQDV